MANENQKVTSVAITARKGVSSTDKIVAITAYDYTFARLFDEVADLVLVGDSVGMVVQGESNTLGVTMEQMIYHTKAVAKGLHYPHLVADMPFLSYQSSRREALKNAGRLLAEGGAEAVKLEGGVSVARTVRDLTQIGIPVLGHIGLTPQRVHAFGGYKIQGKTNEAREAILTDAMALEDAGAYAVVLEGIPEELARDITGRVGIPTIGIGAGPHCDGQILVAHDLLGLFPDFKPRFVKVFSPIGNQVRSAVQEYANEVKGGLFPGPEHSF